MTRTELKLNYSSFDVLLVESDTSLQSSQTAVVKLLLPVVKHSMNRSFGAACSTNDA